MKIAAYWSAMTKQTLNRSTPVSYIEQTSSPLKANSPPFYARTDLSNLQFARNLCSAAGPRLVKLAEDHAKKIKLEMSLMLAQEMDPDPQDCLAYAFCMIALAHERRVNGIPKPGDTELLLSL